MDNSIEYVDIKSNTKEIKQKCRCCSNGANSWIQIDTIIKPTEGTEKTYKNFVCEITQLKVSFN